MEDNRTTLATGRRRRARVLAVLVGLVALFTVGLTTAGPASAASITYSVTNATPFTLSYESAHLGGRCQLFQSIIVCDHGRNYSGSVSPVTVPSGGQFQVQGELIGLGVAPAQILVKYAIGGSPNYRVVLHETTHRVTCTVEGTKAFTCVSRGGLNRDWVLQLA